MQRLPVWGMERVGAVWLLCRDPPLDLTLLHLYPNLLCCFFKVYNPAWP